jgi:hypothetical protein
MKSMMPTTKLLRDFTRLAKTDVSSGDGDPNHENPHSYSKLNYHRLGKRVLKAVAAEMGLPSGTYDIRSNLGGTAVAGEITLHGEHLYIQLCEAMGGLEVLYRSCKGRKDYTGGGNNWMKYDDLLDLPRACDAFRRVMNGTL